MNEADVCLLVPILDTDSLIMIKFSKIIFSILKRGLKDEFFLKIH